MTDNADLQEATFLVRKAISLFGSQVSSTTPWMWESNRWLELVYGVFHALLDMDDASIRQLVAQLWDLNLLQIEDLAGSDPGSGVAVARATRVIVEKGVDEDRAAQVMSDLAQVATAFQQSYGGRIHTFLRGYATKMLAELDTLIRFDHIDATQKDELLVFWLQNTLGMPISQSNANMRRFCDQYGLTVDDLQEAANDLGLNLALLDDLIDEWTSSDLGPRDEPPQ